MVDERGTIKPHGTISDRREPPWNWIVVGLIVLSLSLMSVAVVVGGIIIRQIAAVERHDRDGSRATAYRLCSRGQVDRAFAHSRVRAVGGLEAVRVLERRDGLPILNCLPNLDGQGARPMLPVDQRRFVQRWERGELTGPELGICPDSRIGARASPTHC